MKIIAESPHSWQKKSLFTLTHPSFYISLTGCNLAHIIWANTKQIGPDMTFEPYIFIKTVSQKPQISCASHSKASRWANEWTDGQTCDQQRHDNCMSEMMCPGVIYSHIYKHCPIPCLLSNLFPWPGNPAADPISPQWHSNCCQWSRRDTYPGAFLTKWDSMLDQPHCWLAGLNAG